MREPSVLDFVNCFTSSLTVAQSFFTCRQRSMASGVSSRAAGNAPTPLMNQLSKNKKNHEPTVLGSERQPQRTRHVLDDNGAMSQMSGKPMPVSVRDLPKFTRIDFVFSSHCHFRTRNATSTDRLICQKQNTHLLHNVHMQNVNIFPNVTIPLSKPEQHPPKPRCWHNNQKRRPSSRYMFTFNDASSYVGHSNINLCSIF